MDKIKKQQKLDYLLSLLNNNKSNENKEETEEKQNEVKGENN